MRNINSCPSAWRCRQTQHIHKQARPRGDGKKGTDGEGALVGLAWLLPADTAYHRTADRLTDRPTDRLTGQQRQGPRNPTTAVYVLVDAPRDDAAVTYCRVLSVV